MQFFHLVFSLYYFDPSVTRSSRRLQATTNQKPRLIAFTTAEEETTLAPFLVAGQEVTQGKKIVG